MKEMMHIEILESSTRDVFKLELLWSLCKSDGHKSQTCVIVKSEKEMLLWPNLMRFLHKSHSC